MTDNNNNTAIDAARQLAHHLLEATSLAASLQDHLPIAAPGRGYLEWEQLAWMADALQALPGGPVRAGRSWAEMVVIAVTEALVESGVTIPETHGEGLDPEQYRDLIRQLTKGDASR